LRAKNAALALLYNNYIKSKIEICQHFLHRDLLISTRKIPLKTLEIEQLFMYNGLAIRGEIYA